ncbi:PqqD family protein [Sphingomonas sp. SUN039]|uniref:PqqD family protein n=1 Tax=Sphingomonas sp. SUN039 TaxID=2937787 RepID=UPI002164A77E|nr:PqqD family protein [Sphingomonas sp. SUN039]UVO55779.1 PqqD family protein [Sphingomonas sp. SUN039]
MDPNTIIERIDGMVEAEVGGELVGLDIERGSCFGFNATATRIWHLVGTPQSLGTLCDALMAEHEVDRATCLADTAAVLRVMADEQLVALRAA